MTQTHWITLQQRVYRFDAIDMCLLRIVAGTFTLLLPHLECVVRIGQESRMFYGNIHPFYSQPIQHLVINGKLNRGREVEARSDTDTDTAELSAPSLGRGILAGLDGAD